MSAIKTIHPLIDAQNLRRAADHIGIAQAILEENDRGLWADELAEKCAEMMSRADRLEREFYATTEDVIPLKGGNVKPIGNDHPLVQLFDAWRV